MASPYTLQESLHPALSALGAYTSNLAQYRGQMTPYKRDPRLDNQRAFGDALTAYMQATPQRERMRLEREQLAEQQRRQKILDQRAKELHDQELALAPLNKQLIEQNIAGNERQKKIEEYEIEALKGQQNLRDNWKQLVADSGGTEQEKANMLNLGPKAGQVTYNMVVARKPKHLPLTQEQMSSLVKASPSLAGKEALFHYNTTTKQVEPKFSSDLTTQILKQSTQSTPLTLTQKMSLYPDIDAGLLKNTIVVPDGQGGHKITQLKKESFDTNQEKNYQLAQEDSEDGRKARASLGYMTMFRDKHETPKFETVKDFKGNERLEAVYNPVFKGLKLPTHPSWRPSHPQLVEDIKKQNPESPLLQPVGTSQGTQDTQGDLFVSSGDVTPVQTVTAPVLTQTMRKTVQDGVKSTQEMFVLIDQLDASLQKFGTEAIGEESATQENLYGQIGDRMRILANMGVPNGPDIMLLLQKLLNPASFNFTDTVMSGGGNLIKTEFAPADFIRRQLEQIKITGKLALASAKIMLDENRLFQTDEEMAELLERAKKEVQFGGKKTKFNKSFTEESKQGKRNRIIRR